MSDTGIEPQDKIPIVEAFRVEPRSLRASARVVDEVGSDEVHEGRYPGNMLFLTVSRLGGFSGHSNAVTVEIGRLLEGMSSPCGGGRPRTRGPPCGGGCGLPQVARAESENQPPP